MIDSYRGSLADMQSMRLFLVEPTTRSGADSACIFASLVAHMA